MPADHTMYETQAPKPNCPLSQPGPAHIDQLLKAVRCCICVGILSAPLAGLRTRCVGAAEKPELTMLFPAGGQIGTSVDVVAQGKFPGWPLQAWTDSPHIQWTCQAEAGQLRADIGPEAEPGLHWLRLYNEHGASIARPYLIGRWEEASEVEPNDSVAQAQGIPRLPFSVQGILNKQADVDLFAVQLAQGQLLAATLDSHKWLNSPADASLQILSSRGFVLEENLDHVGLDPYLEFTAPHADTYVVRVFAFPATPDSTIAFSGGSDWVYRLRLETQAAPLASAVDYAKQAELASPAKQVASGAHCTAAAALAVELPVRLSGTLGQPKQADFISFQARAKAHYRLSVLARDCGSPLDATLALFDAEGKELKRIDDVGQNRDPRLDWQSSSDGPVVVSISDFHHRGGQQFGYFLRLEELAADFSLSSGSDLLHTRVGQTLEIPLDVVRALDFAETIEVSLEGLPSSVSCPAVESIHGSDSAATVTLRLTATEPLQMPLKIVARAAAAVPSQTPAESPTEAAAVPPMVERRAETAELKPIWLSVAP